MDEDNIQFNADKSSLKGIFSGSGSISSPGATSGTSPQSNVVTIPHGLGTTELIWSVSIDVSQPYAAFYGANTYALAPWATGDGRTAVDASIDANNLYIRATSSTAGAAQVGYGFTFFYNILLP